MKNKLISTNEMHNLIADFEKQSYVINNEDYVKENNQTAKVYYSFFNKSDAKELLAQVKAYTSGTILIDKVNGIRYATNQSLLSDSPSNFVNKIDMNQFA